MAGFLAWLAVVVSILLPGVAVAEVYRCTIDGKTVFSDRKCEGAPSVVVETGQGSANRSDPDVSARAADPSRDAESMRPDGRKMPGPESPPLWELQNRSTRCLTAEYNRWVRAQPSFPTRDEIDAKTHEIRAQCRERVGLPQDYPYIQKSFGETRR